MPTDLSEFPFHVKQYRTEKRTDPGICFTVDSTVLVRVDDVCV